MAEQPDDVLTIDELAVYLKIAKSTLYKLAKRGDLRVRRLENTRAFARRRLIDGWKRMIVGMEANRDRRL